MIRPDPWQIVSDMEEEMEISRRQFVLEMRAGAPANPILNDERGLELLCAIFDSGFTSGLVSATKYLNKLIKSAEREN